MHIKRIHEMEEKLTEIALCEINKGIECVNTAEMGAVIDMIKDLACAEKEAREAKEMEKEEEGEKKENEYFLKMLKEEYGDEEGEKRFYDNYRYKSSGRFAPKGKGSYMPRGRRGYEEPMYHMPLEMYHDYSPEELRDIDREKYGRLYYTPSNTGNGGGRSGSSMSGGNMGGNAGGSTRGYEDGFNDGNRRGYEDGYRDGESRGRSQGGRRDGREGRSGQSRRSYMETKEMNKGNTPQEKQEKMKELEKYMGELSGDITEMISDASNEEKTMLKSKLQTLVQKIQ